MMIKKALVNRIQDGKLKRIKVYGSSMLPVISSGDFVNLIPIQDITTLNVGDIVVASFDNSNVFVVHRVISIDKNKELIYLRGDNENIESLQNFKYNQIFGKVELNLNNLTNKKTQIIIDLPFKQSITFNTKTYEIYQSLSSNNSNCFYFDLNCEFNRFIYGEDNVDKFNKLKTITQIDAQKFYELMSKKRLIYKHMYGLYQFTYSNLALCDYTNENEIKKLLENYNSTIYYKFFKEKIKEIFKLTKICQNDIEFVLSIDTFDKLIASTIFSLTLKEINKCKVILVDNSTIFKGQYNTSFWNSFFDDILSMSQICKTYSKSNITYDCIDFTKYIPNNHIANVRFMQECYYKKCLFCDRHSRDNFCYNTDNVFEKLVALNKKDVNKIIFVDDCLVPFNMLKLIDKLKDSNISIKWKGTFRFDETLLDENTIYRFKQSGCKMLFFGLESFDQSFLDNIHKGIKVENALKILSLCKKFGIKTSVSFLFNLPTETIQNLLTTKCNLEKYIDLFDHIEFNTFVPTANCKIVEDWNKLNYYEKPLKISLQKQDIINEIKEIGKEKINNSFYLKNFEIWE